jgi:hypothetical protein
MVVVAVEDVHAELRVAADRIEVDLQDRALRGAHDVD